MERIYDMIVIGGGPAGLSAGIYGGRAKLDVLVIEKENKGGQISLTSEVVNYPGILEISGSEFMTQTRKQAQGFGVNFVQEEVVDMDFTQKIKTIKTNNAEYFFHLLVWNLYIFFEGTSILCLFIFELELCITYSRS